MPIYAIAFIVTQSMVSSARGIRTPLRLADLALKAASQGVWILAILTMHDDSFSYNESWRWFGAALTVLGLVVSGVATRQLGKNWVGGVALHKGHVLVRHGLYRIVRHPLYSGMLISALGISFFTQNWFYVATIFLYVGSVLIRMPSEELMLAKKFGRAHQQYAARTKLIIPLLW